MKDAAAELAEAWSARANPLVMDLHSGDREGGVMKCEDNTVFVHLAGCVLVCLIGLSGVIFAIAAAIRWVIH